MSEDYVKKLEGRIVELENELKQMRSSRRQAVDISAEEMQAYLKVREVVAGDWECGINECARCIIQRCIVICRICQICQICLVCSPCDVECTCGPCALGGIERRGVGRFSGLGG